MIVLTPDGNAPWVQTTQQTTMRLKQLFTDEDAVSPVIGVILMVAITVILAAVIGAFVLGIGGDQAQTPQATWSASEEDDSGNGAIDNVTLTHQSGAQIESNNLEVSIPNADNVDVDGDTSLGAGSEINVELSGDSGTSGDDLLLIWSPEGSTDTSTIYTHTFTSEYGENLDSASA